MQELCLRLRKLHQTPNFHPTALTNNSQDKKVPWLTEYVARLSNYKPSNKYALLIGIANYHPESGVSSLKRPGNDIKAMRELSTEKYAFPPGNITTLADADATHEV